MGLSEIVMTAIAAKVSTVTGIAIGDVYKSPTSLQSASAMPYAQVYIEGPWEVLELRFRQVERTLPVIGLVTLNAQQLGFSIIQGRAWMSDWLDAIEGAILLDSTLGGAVTRAVPHLVGPLSDPKSTLVFGPFEVRCVSIARLVA